jgi:hypothetical protein
VTVKLPLAEGVHERVEEPKPVILGGLRVHVSPVEGETDAARLTAPLNPLTDPIVMVEVPAWPTLTATLVWLALTWKSWTA